MSNKEKAFTYYTNGEKTIKVKPDQTPPEGFYKGQHYKRPAWNKGLSAKTDERVKNNVEKAHATRNKHYHAPWNKGLTKETDERVAKNSQKLKEGMLKKYGVENPSQLPTYTPWNKGRTKENDSRMKKASDNHKGVIAWNKGLTKDTDERIVSRPRTEETKQKIREANLTTEVRLKRFNSLKANGTLGNKYNTKPERDYYEYLLTKYKPEDIVQQYSDERYPFKCDFYIIPEDLFIELHANWTHGKHPFDKNNPEDIEVLKIWKEKSKEHPYYSNAIYTWTDLDVRKAETAKLNNLNYKVIY